MGADFDPRAVLVPAAALAAGFSNSPIGTHTGKTMMLAELRRLLEAVPGPVDFDEYQRATVEDNALGKSTAANRSNTLMYLKQLYGLRRDVPVFAALSELWQSRPADQPILAGLCANARDVLFRSTADLVLATPAGAPVGSGAIGELLAGAYPNRYAASTLRNLSVNIATSWSQTGLLSSTTTKLRATPSVDVAAVAYALYLGHLEGAAGPVLFTTRWARLLDRTDGELRRLAEAAGRSGWIDYRSTGGMTEVGFRHLDGVTGWGGR